MTNSTERRQEIYNKIKASSRTEYILSEMKRLGFWSEKDLDLASVERFLKEEKVLSKELHKLIAEKNIVRNPEAFLAQKHKERKRASKQSQKETKERREQERQEKARRWEISKARDIIYLGENYSHELNHKSSDTQKLLDQQLVVMHTAEDLAKAMEISIAELRFLSFSRKKIRKSVITKDLKSLKKQEEID